MGVLGRIAPIVVLTRVELRRRWRATLVLTLLFGVVAAVVLGAAINARRAQTAFPRLVRDTQAMHALAGVVVPPPVGQDFYRQLAERPEVETAGYAPGLAILRVDEGGNIDYSLRTLAALEGGVHTLLARPRTVAGRLPDPNRADEVYVNKPFADRDHLHVGDRLTGYRAFPGYKNPVELTAADGVPVDLHVVGIGIDPASLLSDSSTPNSAILFVTPAFYRAHPEAFNIAFVGARLRDPANSEAVFEKAAERLANSLPGRPPGTPFIFGDERAVERQVERAITPEAAAYALFATILGVAALVTIGQAFSRQAASWDANAQALRALGFTSLQLSGGLLCIALLMGIGAAVLAVALGAASSIITPIGTAKLAEQHPGFSVNIAWSGVGFVVVVAAMVVIALPSVWRRRRTRRVDRPSFAGRRRAARQLRLPLAADVAVQFGFRGRGQASRGVRGAVLTILLAVIAVVVTLTFASNLHRLVSTPPLYGQTWDAALDAEPAPVPTGPMTSILRSDADVSDFVGGNHGVVGIGGQSIPALGIDPIAGGPYPTILEGRAATGTDEIALGTRTLDAIRRRVGDSVEVDVGGAPKTMRIVGRVIFPKFVLGAFQRPELGDGASVRARLLAPPQATADDLYTFFLVRLKDGVATGPALARLQELTRPLAPCPFGPCVVPTQRPNDVASFRRIAATPLVLSALLAIFAALTLAHVLITSVRTGRGAFAVLATLGFRPRQLAAVVLWQAVAVALFAALVGVVVGSVLGTRAWSGFADRIGTSTDASVPVVVLIILGVVALVGATLAAIAPAAIARRTNAATQLSVG